MRPLFFVMEIGDDTSFPDALTYAAGGGATMRFLRGADEAWDAVLGVAASGDPTSGAAGSGTLLTTPDSDRLAVVAYPELRLFIVSCRVSVGVDVPFEVVVGVGASTANAAAACLSTFKRFLSSFVCSPGHSAGTFIWHLL